MPDWLDDEDGPRFVDYAGNPVTVAEEEAQVSNHIRWTKRELGIRREREILAAQRERQTGFALGLLIGWVVWLLALIWLMGYGMHLQAELSRGPR